MSPTESVNQLVLDTTRDEHIELELQSFYCFRVRLRDWHDVELLHFFLVRTLISLLSCQFIRKDLLVYGLRVEFIKAAISRIYKQVANFHLRCIFSHGEHRYVTMLLILSIEILKFAIRHKVAFFALHEVFGLDQLKIKVCVKLIDLEKLLAPHINMILMSQI